MEHVEACYPVSYAVHGAVGRSGDWRVLRPVIDRERCSKCLQCWVYCSEACIDKETLEIDYDYCKGCGICAVECAKKAIEMVKEG